MRNRSMAVLCILLSLAACSRAPQTAQLPAAAVDAAAPMPAASADVDVRPSGATGVPAGFMARTDSPAADISAAKYVRSGDGWEVTTGPAHILYSPNDRATGAYTVSATIEQLETPRHPEAFGVFIGGSDLAGPNQTYTYFLVRGTGEIFARSRSGSQMRGLIAWQPSKSVPRADSTGRQAYRIQVRVTADSLHFLVNDRRVTALPKGDIPTNGIAGLRINHNLRLRVTRVEISKP